MCLHGSRTPIPLDESKYGEFIYPCYPCFTTIRVGSGSGREVNSDFDSVVGRINNTSTTRLSVYTLSPVPGRPGKNKKKRGTDGKSPKRLLISQTVSCLLPSLSTPLGVVRLYDKEHFSRNLRTASSTTCVYCRYSSPLTDGFERKGVIVCIHSRPTLSAYLQVFTVCVCVQKSGTNH